MNDDRKMKALKAQEPRVMTRETEERRNAEVH